MKIQELWLNVLLLGFLSNAISGQNAWNIPMKIELRSGAWDFKGLKGHGTQDIHSWRPGDSQVKNLKPQHNQQSKINTWGPEDSQHKDHANVNFPKDTHGEIGLTSPEIIVTGWKELHDGISEITKDIDVSGFNNLHSGGVSATTRDSGNTGFNQLHEDSVLQTESGINQQSNEGWTRDEHNHKGDENWKDNVNRNRNEGWARDEHKQQGDESWKANLNQQQNDAWSRDDHKQHSDDSWKSNVNQPHDEGWTRGEHKQHSDDSWKANVNQPHDEGRTRGEHKQHSGDSWKANVNQPHEGRTRGEHKQQGDERWRADVNQQSNEGYTGHGHQHNEENWKVNVNQQGKDGWTRDEKHHIDESVKSKPNVNKENNEGWSKEEHREHSWKVDQHEQKSKDGLISDKHPQHDGRSTISGEKKQNSGIGWTPEENQRIPVDNWAPEANQQTYNRGWTLQEKQDIPAENWTPESNNPTANKGWTPQEQQKISVDFWTPDVNQPTSDSGWTPQNKHDIPADNWIPETKRLTPNNGFPPQEKQNIPVDNWTPEENRPISNNGWTSQEKQNIPVDNWTPEVNQPTSNNGWTSQEKQNIPLDNWTPEVNGPTSNNGWTSQEKQNIPVDNWPPEVNQPTSNNGWTPQEKDQISGNGWISDENQNPTPGSWIPEDNVAKTWNEENKNEDKWKDEGSRKQTNTNAWSDGNIKKTDDWSENKDHREKTPEFGQNPTEYGGTSTFLGNKPITRNSWGGNNNELPATINPPTDENFPENHRTFTDDSDKLGSGTIPPTGVPGQWPDEVNNLNNDDPTAVHLNVNNFDNNRPKGDFVPTESPFINRRPQGNYKGGDGTYYENDGNTEISYASTIPGTAGIDYPDYTSIPQTGFDCKSQQFPGYFADIETRCQVYHVCQSDGRHNSFLCPTGTIFNQKLFTCDWWHNYDCTTSTDHYNLNQMLYREGDAQGNYKGSHYPGQARQNVITGDIQGAMRQNRGLDQGWTTSGQTRANAELNHGHNQGWNNDGQNRINTEQNHGQNQPDHGWTNNEQSRINTAHNHGQDQGWTDNEQTRVNTEYNHGQDQGWTNKIQTNLNTEHNRGRDEHDLGWTNNGQTRISTAHNHGLDEGWSNSEQPRIDTEHGLGNDQGWSNSEHTRINTEHVHGQNQGWTNREQTRVNTEQGQGLTNSEQASRNTEPDYGHNKGWTDNEQTGINTGLGWTESSQTGENFETEDKVAEYGNYDEKRKDEQYPLTDDNSWNIKRQDTGLWDKETDEWNYQSQAIGDSKFNDQIKIAIEDVSPITESDIARSQNWKDEEKNLEAAVDEETGWIVSPEHVQTSVAEQDSHLDSILQDDRSKFEGKKEANNGWITNSDHDQMPEARQESHIDAILQEDRSKPEDRHKGTSEDSVEYSDSPRYSDEARYSDIEKISDGFAQEEKFGSHSNEKGIADKTELNNNKITQMDTAPISASQGEESLDYGVSSHMSSVLEGVRDESNGLESRKSSMETSMTSALKPERQKILGARKEVRRTGKENDEQKSTFTSAALESGINKFEGTEKPGSQNERSSAPRRISDILEPEVSASEVFDSKMEKPSYLGVNSMVGQHSERAFAQEGKFPHALALDSAASFKPESMREPEIISQSQGNMTNIGKNINIYSAGGNSAQENRLPSIVAQKESLISKQNDFPLSRKESSIGITEEEKWAASEKSDMQAGNSGFNSNVRMNPQVTKGNLRLHHDHELLRQDLVNLHHNQGHMDDITEQKEEEIIETKANGQNLNAEQIKIHDDGNGQPVMTHILKNRDNNQLELPDTRLSSNVSDDKNVSNSNHPMFNFRVSSGKRYKFFQALNPEASGDGTIDDGDLIRSRKTTFTSDAGDDINGNGKKSPRSNFKVVKVRRNKALQTSDSEAMGESNSQVGETAGVGDVHRNTELSSMYDARVDASSNKLKRIKFVFKIPSGNINKFSQSQPVDAADGVRSNFAFNRRTSYS